MVTSTGKQINLGAKSTEFLIVFSGAEVEHSMVRGESLKERKC